MAKRLGFDLVLLGAPAAGKDTQATILERIYTLKPIESGSYLRRIVKQKNADGILLRKSLSVGKAAPIKIVQHFLTQQLARVPQNADFIFVGNPRLKPEAQLLVKLLRQKKRDFYVLNIDLPQADIKTRSLKRMRDDQDWKYVDNRIKMYRLQVYKTIKYFQSLNKLKVINGKQSISKVALDIRRAINDYQRQQTNNHLKAKRQDSGKDFKSGGK